METDGHGGHCPKHKIIITDGESSLLNRILEYTQDSFQNRQIMFR